jgi:HK97 family phage major capsid protein
MSVKELMQKREALVKEMTCLVDAADVEKRSLNEDEQKKFADLKAQVADIDATIEAKRALEDAQVIDDEDDEDKEPETRSAEDVEELEVRAFEQYLRSQGRIETRDDANMTFGANGAVVPTSIANRIVEDVLKICPIYADADRYNVKGSLTLPYYDESSSQIVCGYATEFVAPDATTGKFSAITLTGFLGEALTNVSKSLINNSQFDIVGFVVRKVAEAIAKFIEKELLIGTPATTSGGTTVPAKIEGLSSLAAGQIIESAANTAITADELIKVQEQVPDQYQANAYWIMNKKTRTEIRQLKESGTGAYLLNKDANSRWGYTLFGKDVYTTDTLPEVKAANAGKVAVYYGDMKGLAVKVSEDIEVEVLRETMATKHAVQIVGFVELDSKVQNSEMIAGLALKSA